MVLNQDNVSHYLCYNFILRLTICQVRHLESGFAMACMLFYLEVYQRKLF